MRILFLGINYAPEPVGIGPYSSGAAEALAAMGHEVEVVAALPYYPDWRTPEAYRRLTPRRDVENGVRVTRVPIYVPARPNGIRRVLHHMSFALSAALPMLGAAIRRRPDIVFTVAPSMMSTPLANLAARVAGAPCWVHIQDFEVGAALATGLIAPDGMAARVAKWFEKFAYGGASRWSSISPQMCRRLEAAGFPRDRIVEFRNWTDLTRIEVRDVPSPYRQEWGITAPHVALYSGNISNKQGIELVLDAARALQHRPDIHFAVCGSGPQKAPLMAAASGMTNISFHDLQPMERLSELLGLATIHLLPQLAGAADLVLPSKLTNMLASGRPVVATAAAGTGLADEVEGCGIVTPPGDASAFAAAIARLADDPVSRAALGSAARARAEERWSKHAILDRFASALAQVARK